ncbi:hypothetical protein K523DRAFT_350704 [Schizophyllum commune Tattone D]|nr:hypothetical protein K523DRAFT_350704 [Schizophyllum commune Tattone D]
MARRQPSTTSLSKYARSGSPIIVEQDRALDFCNAFWGLGDGGVDVLFARMRGASRTTDELRNFWKERASIEEDYAKRLAKLAKGTLGRDEIGELRNSLDTIRTETERQAGYHLQLAQQIRTDLEGSSADFYARQVQHKKTYQAMIEKQFRQKQEQEARVMKAREKYEADCLLINSYTAQSTLVQGRDLDKITSRLERAQRTVQANERDFANFAKTLQTTAAKWEQDWKDFCDSCQDLEEDRLDFMRDNMWAYANAVSTVCVTDDESCEKMRLSLEQMETEKEMENFVLDYGTGNRIPDPPAFVDYNKPDAIPSASSRPTARPAHFTRTTQRRNQGPTPALAQPPPPQPDPEPATNVAGVGAGGPARSRPTSIVNGVPSSSPSTAPAQQAVSRRQSYRRPPPDAGRVESPEAMSDRQPPQQQQQQQHRANGSMSAAASPSNVKPGSAVDPLLQHMEELKNSGASVRRSTTSARTGRSPQPTTNPPSRRGTQEAQQARQSMNLSPHGDGPARDYQSSADMVVGSHPSSRPSSPANPPAAGPPTAAFMRPTRAVSPAGSDHIETVLNDYHQSLPGERKSASRRGSFAAPSPSNAHIASPSNAHMATQSEAQNLHRPPSVGHAGIGAHGGGSRSASPQPISRSASPNRQSYIQPPGPTNQNLARQPSMAQRATSPNNVGIALDASGRVLHDEMAQRYQQQQQQQRPPTQPPPQQQPAYGGPQRRTSYLANQGYGMYPPQGPPQAVQPPPPPTQPPPPAPPVAQPPPPPVQAPPPAPYVPAQTPSYAAQPAYQPGFGAPPPQQQPPPQQVPYTAPQPQGYGQPAYPAANQPPAFGAPPPQQPAGYGPGYGAANNVNGVQRNGYGAPAAAGGGYYGQQAPAGYNNQPAAGYGQFQQQPMHRSPSPQPVRQAPAPAPQPQGVAPPTGQMTEDGRGILFYVKALYDYTATIDEEFDFQAGDIIAVTATPEDGWWSGELLDEDRRQRGRHVFPSNFVCLF